MDKSTATTPNNNMKKFMVLIIAVVVLVAAVAVGIFIATRGTDGKEYQPNNDLWSGEDPSGYDDDHTARY